LKPVVQEQEVCGALGSCAKVVNLLARWDPLVAVKEVREETGDGEEVLSESKDLPPEALLLVAHYDSTPTSPGASDNLAGVACVLEMIRALRAGATPTRSLIVLFSDGEEIGLLGAEAFRQEHPWAHHVRTVINLDSRGSAGASMLFQVSGEIPWVVGNLATQLPSPSTSSSYQAVFPFVPADTDFSVFRRLGVHGVDIASVGQTTNYHSDQDRLEKVVAGTLQDQGENALALARAFLKAPIPASPGRTIPTRTYFDVFRRTVFHWSASVNLLLALMALLCLGAIQGDLQRREHLEISSTLEEVLWLGMTGLGAAFLALVGYQILSFLGALPAPWIAYPQPMLVVFGLLALAAHGLGGARSWRWNAFWESWLGVWASWVLLGLFLAWKLPGMSYLFLVPAVFAGLGGILTLAVPDLDRYPRLGFVVVLPVLVAGILWMAPMRFLFLVVGFHLRIGLTLALFCLFMPLLPLLAVQDRSYRIGLGVMAAALAVLMGLVTVCVPVFTRNFPQPVSLIFHQETSDKDARWLIEGVWGPPPKSMHKVGGFTGAAGAAFPWSDPWLPSYQASSPRISELKGPRLEDVKVVLEAGQRRIIGTLRSSRKVIRLGLGLGPGARLISARLGGRRIPLDEKDHPHLKNGWCFLNWWQPGKEGVSVELVLEGEGKVPTVIYDLSSGLPESGRGIMEARGEATTLLHTGAGTLLTRKGEL
jgi:hypothetical protein